MPYSEALLSQHRLSVDDYHRMGRAGIFDHDERLELIEGRLIDMAPIGSDHAGKVIQLNAVLNRAFARLALVSPQNPIRLSEHSEPQPDFAVLRPRADFYRTAHPQPPDVLLVIEVADTSVRYDREVKIPLYARHGIPEVWLLDLHNTRLEIYRRPRRTMISSSSSGHHRPSCPGTEGYGEVLYPANDDSIAPVLLPDAVLSIADFWS